MPSDAREADAAFAALVADLIAWGDGVRERLEEEQGGPRVAAMICGRAGRQVRVKCPYCGRSHIHGVGGVGGGIAGHRIAHCGRGGYVLAVESIGR